MNNVERFKSFNMGRELEIAGDFIYESAKRMLQLDTIYEHFDINAILYFGSVGIERLQKILICLFEPDLNYNKKLSHNMKAHLHLNLQKQIDSYGITMEKNELSLLGMFQDYYNNYRYGEFKPEYNSDSIAKLFSNFLEKSGKKWEIGSMMLYKDKMDIKKFYINVLGDLALKYFNNIREKAFSLNVFTYEIDSFSNAAKALWIQPNQFFNKMELEQLSLIELLLFIYKTNSKKSVFDILNSIKPINFDVKNIETYLEDIVRYKSSVYLNDEVSEFYAKYSKDDLRKRKETLSLIGCKDVFFDDL